MAYINGNKTFFALVGGGGISSTLDISEDGYWIVDGIKTVHKAVGKSAYEYAVDGGYPGTETEFATKLAYIIGQPLVGKITEDDIRFTGTVPKGIYTVHFDMDDGDSAYIGDLVSAQSVTFSVSRTLKNCTISNKAQFVEEGESYKATITADDEYTLNDEDIIVTMGGDPVTVKNGTIDISSVTGHIVIEAEAEPVAEEKDPTNQISISLDENDEPYIGKTGEIGYQTGVRIRSRGEEAPMVTASVTGFIPVQGGDILYIDVGMDVSSENSGNTSIVAYYADTKEYTENRYFPSNNGWTKQADGTYTLTVPSDGTGFVRLSIVKIMNGTETIYIKRNGKWI